MSSSRGRAQRRPLTSTYRLQLNAEFTLRDARARVDYFDRLGVSHLYLSPIFAARRDSQHGYDVVDPARVNPELGGEDELRVLADELHGRSMGMIVDIVPNHMGIGDENPYWDDVLTHGERSRFARWFDIDWTHHKVVLPILGEELDRALDLGRFSVQLREGETPRITYFEKTFPIDPDSLPADLQLAQVDPEEAAELASRYSGRAGASKLREVLHAQHYKLVYWRRGDTEINYRRFFDVDHLAGVRVEDPEVFDATHALVLRLVRDDVIDGLRIDHIDGLLDPAAYLERLRAATPADMPIFVEKILAPGERLPDAWPVQGTTGYEFLNDVENVFLDADGAAEVERFYRRMRRLGSTTFHDVSRVAKANVLTGALRADVDRLVGMLAPAAIARNAEWSRDMLADALIAFVASLPVYRTYIDGRSPISTADRAAIRRASDEAIENGAARDIIDLIASTLLGANDDRQSVAFAQRLQQLSGPAAAKGVEDTALYVYVPIVSRDEVGGEPGQTLRGAVERFHRANAYRAECWPLSLVTTNTHDAKRSADVRSRLDALSELPADWERVVKRWRKLNAKHRRVVRGRLAPDTNTEYLMYQVLVALWPSPRAGRRKDDIPTRDWRQLTRARLSEYAIKAAREAKIRTSWVDPDDAYERAVADFVEAIFEPGEDAPFLPDVARLVARIAPLGALNAVARLVVHLTAPGTPDLFQGDELWNYALVDPDNRQWVDFDARDAALSALPGDVVSDPAASDSRLKLLVTQRLLCLRRTMPDVFVRGGYMSLNVTGAKAQHVIGFARWFEGRMCVAVVPRIIGSYELVSDRQWWRDTVIHLPQNEAGDTLRSALVEPLEVDGRNPLELGKLFEKLPVAVLVN